MTKHKIPLTGIRIPDNLKNQLMHIAECENRSFTNLVNVILQEYALKYNTEKKDTPSK